MTSHRLRKLIVICFHLLFLTVPFFFTWVNEELFEFPKMLLTYGLTLIITSLWISRMMIEKKILIKPTVFDWPLLFFLVSQTLSTIFSIHPRTSILGYYTRFHGGLLSTLTYTLLFYALVNNLTRADLKKLWLSIFMGAVGMSLYAIPEHFGYSPSCLMILGQLDVSCWVQDVQNRVFATFGQPNWLAAYAITLLPMGLAWVLGSRRRWAQVLAGVTSLGLFVTLLFTQSRSGLLGFGAGFVTLAGGLWWLKYRRWPPSIAPQINFRPFWLLLAIMSLVAVLNGTSFTPAVSQIFSPSSSAPTAMPTPPLSPTPPAPPTPAAEQPVNRLTQGGTDSGEIRRIVWQGALDVWQRYPLLGSGTATFAYSYYQDRPLAHNLVSEWDFLYNKAHNEFLNLLATTGVVGLAAYLCLLGWFGRTALKTLMGQSAKKEKVSLVQANRDLKILALMAGLVGLTVSNFFGFSTVMVSVLMFSYLGMMVTWTDPLLTIKQAQKLNQATPPKLRGGQLMGLILITLSTIALLSKLKQMWVADKAFATGKSYFIAGYAKESLTELQTAIKLRPREALYHNELADIYAQLAVTLAEQKQSTAAAEFTQGALTQSELTLELNPRHLNFYKGRARTLISLSSIEPDLLLTARQTLLDAIELAPTDAKLRYNLGLIEISLDQVEAGVQTLEETIDMKPNYEAARLNLGKQYEELGKSDQARQQYQYIYDHITTNNQLVNQKLGLVTPIMN